MERWIEPKPPLRRERRLHRDIGDQETVAEDFPHEGQAQRFTHETAGAVCGEQPIGVQGIIAVWGLHADGCTGGIVGEAHDFVLPA